MPIIFGRNWAKRDLCEIKCDAQKIQYVPTKLVQADATFDFRENLPWVGRIALAFGLETRLLLFLQLDLADEALVRHC